MLLTDTIDFNFKNLYQTIFEERRRNTTVNAMTIPPRHEIITRKKNIFLETKAPESYRREMQGLWNDTGGIPRYSNRMLFRILTYSLAPVLRFPVVADGRGVPYAWIYPEFILHPEILSRFTPAHDLCGVASIRGASSAGRYRAIGRGKSPPPFVPPLSTVPRPREKSFLENLYGSTIDLPRA